MLRPPAALAALLLSACADPEPAPPAPRGQATTWLPSDTGEGTLTAGPMPAGSATVDTGPEAPTPLTLALSVPEGTPVAPFEHLELVMIHSPGGGWFLDVTGHIGGLLRDPSLIGWTGDAALPQGASATSLTVYQKVPAEGGAGEVPFIRHFIDLGDSDDPMGLICSLGDTLALLDVRLEDLDDGRAVTVRQTLTLRLDPIDEPNCD